MSTKIKPGLTPANPKVKAWWLALADQYEEWADNPPFYDDELDVKTEMATCNALHDTPMFRDKLSIVSEYTPYDCIVEVWRPEYGLTDWPAGMTYDLDRDDRRYEFCMWMAETIRANVEGK